MRYLSMRHSGKMRAGRAGRAGRRTRTRTGRRSGGEPARPSAAVDSARRTGTAPAGTGLGTGVGTVSPGSGRWMMITASVGTEIGVGRTLLARAGVRPSVGFQSAESRLSAVKPSVGRRRAPEWPRRRTAVHTWESPLPSSDRPRRAGTSHPALRGRNTADAHRHVYGGRRRRHPTVAVKPLTIDLLPLRLGGMLQRVAVLALDGVAAFELGVICEVFGVDRTADGLPRLPLRRLLPRRAPGPGPLRLRPLPQPTWPRSADADLVAVPAMRQNPPDRRWPRRYPTR